MTLLDSLLDAIIRLDGDALVMHVGEKPYVVTTSSSMSTFRGPVSWGQVELSSRPLTVDAVLGMLGQMLTHEQCRQLYELGAIEHEIDAPGQDGERFIVTAARGGDDVWVEVRRRQRVAESTSTEVPPASPDSMTAQASVIVAAEVEAFPAVVGGSPAQEQPEAEGTAEYPPQIELPVESAALLEQGHQITESAGFAQSEFIALQMPIEVGDRPNQDVIESFEDADVQVSLEPEVFEPVMRAEPGQGDSFEIEMAAPSASASAGSELPREPIFAVRPDQIGDQWDDLVLPSSASQEETVAELLAAISRDVDVDEPPVVAASAPIEPPVVAVSAPIEIPAAVSSPIEPPVVAVSAPIEPLVVAVSAPIEIAAEAVAVSAPIDPPAVAVSTPIEPPAVAVAAPIETPAVAVSAPIEPPAPPAPAIAAAVPAAVEEPAPSRLAVPTSADAPVFEPAPAATVHPIARPTLKLQPPQPPPPATAASTEASLVELLRTAVARRASTLYAVAGSRPMIRVDAEIEQLGTEPIVTGAEVERFALEFAPRDQIADAPTEWTCGVPGIGRVRSVTFHDHSGAGLILHLPTADAGTAEGLELDAQIQSLCDQPDGLIVVAGPRASGKSTMLNTFVDFINRTRNEHVITIESEIRVVHQTRRSFISQREVHGDGEAFATAARAALREGPDVIVIADLRAPEAIGVALDAARAGRLVFGAIAAPSASAAVARLIDAFADDRRPQIRALLAGAVRAVVAQVLLEKPGGGRVGARELLLNSPAVGKLIVDGMTTQLPVAIEAGRRLGMNTMIDSLGELVRNGVVDAAEACRQAPDRAALIVALRRDGIDVSNLERRA